MARSRAILGIVTTLCILLAPTRGGAAAPPGKKAVAKPGTSSAKSGSPAPTTVTSAPSATAKTKVAAADSGLTLHGGEEGTAFRSLTVEGEDRIHVEFDHPVLELDLDAEHAPGLDWGSAHDVLDRTQPDLMTPLLGMSARQRSPYLARPWLRQLSSGAVATFRPEVEGVERWKLVVVSSGGEAVASFTGQGRPPREIPWDGRAANGALAVEPGRTYSSVFEAYDRAGNKRNFVGPGFVVSGYRLESRNGPMMIFTGEGLFGGAERSARSSSAIDPMPGGESGAVPPLLLEAASWLNQWERTSQPIRVTAAARSFDEANALSAAVARTLGSLVIGGPARIQTANTVEADAPPGGTIKIAPLESGPATPEARRTR